MRELVDLILLLNKQLDVKIPELNQGGCGIFALKMARELKRLGYSPNIVIITRDYEPTNEKKEVLNKIMNNEPVDYDQERNTSFVHCCVEVGGLHFDGLKIGLDLLERWETYKFDGTYTEEEMELALKVGGWNDTYDRRKNKTLFRLIENGIEKMFPRESFTF